MKKIFLTAMMAAAVLSAAAQEEETVDSPLTFETNLNSNALWRGTHVTGLSAEGIINYSVAGFSAGVDAISTIGKDDYNELDFYISYQFKGAFVSLTDYSWTMDKFEYFGPYKEYHFLELGVGYDFSEITDLPLSISYNVMLAGANRTADDKQGYSSYLEIGFTPSLACGIDLDIALGMALEGEESALMYTKKDGFNVCNAKFGVSKTYNLKNFCTVTPNVNIMCNPTGFGDHGEAYFSAGVGFAF